MKKTAEKWYKRIGFDPKYDAQFYLALEKCKLTDDINVADYPRDSKNGADNLIAYLYFCEALEKRYIEKGIPQSVLDATLADIPRWLDIWSGIEGGLFLGELNWLWRHLDMRLFRLGELQFYMTEKALEIHIPAGAKITPENCRESISLAKEFFAKYFPQYSYPHFTCHSWLLDKTLADFLSENSNIIKFQNMFDITDYDESDAVLRYIFGWDADRQNIMDRESVSSLASKIKAHVKGGGKFYQGYGILK